MLAMDAFDARVRQKVRAARPNQKQLAKELGRSQGWVSKYLSGGNATATIDDVAAMASFLNTTVSALVDERPYTPLTALERQAQQIATLWMRAKPSTRRCIREYLEMIDGVARQSRD
jgi:transcriptional regulator with XRE-family HTH domain